MKVAMVGHKKVPSRAGGIEIVVEELSKRLVKRNHEIFVYNRGTNKEREYEGIKLVSVPTVNIPGISAYIYSFIATIKSLFGKYDILHFHAEGPCVFLLLPHIFKKKIVVTIHGLDWQRAKWKGIAKKIIRHGEKCAVKYADEIIVLSKNVQKYFKETYNRDTIFIPNGVNKSIIKKPNIILKKYNLIGEDYILFLARIVPEKGVHYLIDAYNNLNTDKKLVIAGGSGDADEYFKYIEEKANTNKNIIMTGFVEGEELEELFSNCYVYCLPSDLEGMPISLLEAMSYGRRCIVSNIEENVQVIRDDNTGEIYAETFEKGNANNLTSVLSKCLNNSFKYSNEEISKYILNTYNWDKVTDKTEEIYKNLLKSKD